MRATGHRSVRISYSGQLTASLRSRELRKNGWFGLELDIESPLIAPSVLKPYWVFKQKLKMDSYRFVLVFMLLSLEYHSLIASPKSTEEKKRHERKWLQLFCLAGQLAGCVILGVALWLRHDSQTSNLLILQFEGHQAPSTYYISEYTPSPAQTNTHTHTHYNQSDKVNLTRCYQNVSHVFPKCFLKAVP